MAPINASNASASVESRSATAACFFAAPEHEMLAEIEGESVLFQRFARNEPRAQFG